MASIDDEDCKLQDRFDVFEIAIAKVRTATTFQEKRKEEKVARSLLNDIKSDSQKFRKSINKLDDPIQRSVYNRKYNAYDKKLTEYDQELKILIIMPTKAKTPYPKKETKHSDSLNLDGEITTPQQILNKANEVQDDILKSISNSNRIGCTVRDQTHTTLEILAQQTEKMSKIDGELNEIDEQLDRAKTDVLWFFRQMFKNKCCIMIMVLLLLGVCALIGWKVYSKRFENMSPVSTTTILPQPSSSE